MRSTKTSCVRLTLGALIGLASAQLAIPLAAMAQSSMGTPSGTVMRTAESIAPKRNEKAALAGPGVNLVSCAVDPATITVQASAGVGPSTPMMASGVDVHFMNSGNATADSVGILVSYAGEQRLIVDKGRFSPGIMIDHRFPAFTGAPFLSQTPDACTIANVHFEDGTITP